MIIFSKPLILIPFRVVPFGKRIELRNLGWSMFTTRVVARPVPVMLPHIVQAGRRRERPFVFTTHTGTIHTHTNTHTHTHTNPHTHTHTHTHQSGGFQTMLI